MSPIGLAFLAMFSTTPAVALVSAVCWLVLMFPIIREHTADARVWYGFAALVWACTLAVELPTATAVYLIADYVGRNPIPFCVEAP